MRLIICLPLLLVIFGAQAQKNAKFHSQNYVGLLEGQAGPFVQVQSINGLQLRGWFAGIGTGLDYYQFRSVPLFLSLNKNLCSCDRSLFFSIDGGYNFVWDKSTSNEFNFGREGTFRPAAYWAAGIGYRLNLNHNRNAILMNIGFSAKHAKEVLKGMQWCGWAQCDLGEEKILYRMNRVSLRLGWQF